MHKKKYRLLKWIFLVGTGLTMGTISVLIWFSRLNAAFEASQESCQATSACVLMQVGICGNVQAIHVSQVDSAVAYTWGKKLLNPMIVCSPEVPIEAFEPLCLNQKCQAVGKSNHLFLDVPAQPVAGQPFPVGMGFRFQNSGEVEIQFLLPPGVRITNGQATWSRPVEAMKDYAVWVEMQSDTPGTMYLSGLAKMNDGSQESMFLHWGDYFTIIPEGNSIPDPARERLLATPTVQP